MFKEGGPHRIKKTAPDQYTMRIQVPPDSDGLQGRECKHELCSPAYFKVKPGTGITGAQEEAFCPYCRHSDTPDNFVTEGQIEYAKDIALREAYKGISNVIEGALGLGPSRKGRVGGEFFSMELTYKPGLLPQVRSPMEEEIRRDVRCPECGLEHAVFGLATWCPDCGTDIFLAHVEREFSVVRKMLGDVDRRRQELGGRVAARDIENALEDSVSIFEAALRATTKRYLKEREHSDAEIDVAMGKRIGNRFQNVKLAAEVSEREFGVQLFEGIDERKVRALSQAFEKRHPITHNLGVVDRKYLERARSGELEGREIRVTAEEIEMAIDTCLTVLSQLHSRLFPPTEGKQGKSDPTR